MECKILPLQTFLLVCVSLLSALSVGQEFNREYSLQGVVGSAISLRCPAPAEANVEIVNWMIDTPVKTLYVTYVVKDKKYTHRIPGYGIVNDTTLFISSLTREDSKRFVSKMLTVATDEFMSCVVNLNVLDGCELWNYTSPLQSSTKECSSGGLINYNTTCTFVCDAGFRLEGTRSTQCLANAELSSTLSQCKALSVGREVISEYNLQGVVGSSISLRCLAPAEASVETVRWMSYSPVTTRYVKYIVKDKHYRRRLPGYGIINDTTLSISSLTRRDSRKFVSKMLLATTDEFMSCVVNLKVLDGCELWNYTSPLQNSTKECSSGGLINYNTTCTFDCDAGFRLEGSRSTQCLANGELSSTLPQCKAIHCTLPHFPSNLRSTNAMCNSGSQVWYLTECGAYCDVGYQLVGHNKVTCLANGQFNKPLPVCEDQTSMSPGYLSSLVLNVPLAIILTSIGIWMLINKIGKGRRKNRASGTRRARYEEKSMEDCIPIFTEQLPTESRQRELALLKVLATLQLVEHALISGLLSLTHFEYQRTFIQQTHTRTEQEAVAHYTIAIIMAAESCGTTWRRETALNALLSENDTSEFSEWLSAKSDNAHPLHVKENKQIDKYLDIIGSAFAQLLKSHLDRLEGDDLRNFTTKVIRTLGSYNKLSKTKLAAQKSDETSTRTLNKDGISKNDAFVELCMKDIKAVERIANQIKLRKNIVEIILTKK